MKNVGIVICNYNKKALVRDCIQAVLEQSFADYDLYVVDNGSTDGSAEMIREEFADRLTLIVNEENLGGTGGFNTGLSRALEDGHKYLMCVDNDAMLDENAVRELYGFMEAHPEVGMAASKIYHLEDPDYVQNFGQKIDFDHFATEAYFYNEPEDGSMPEFVFCDAVPACSLMVRSSVVREIGMLPGHCYLYWDDTEWCHKCRLAGYRVASVGSSKALHSMGAKTEYTTTFPTYYAIRNMISFFMRYAPMEQVSMMGYEFLSMVYEEQFAGFYNDITNRPRTVMAAYDDAIHGITGRAGEDRIFEVDRNTAQYESLFQSFASYDIVDNGNVLLREKVIGTAAELGTREKILSEGRGECHIELCSSILSNSANEIARRMVDEGIEPCVLIDQNECIVNASEVRSLQADYAASRDLYVYSQMPIFIRQVKALRKKEEK